MKKTYSTPTAEMLSFDYTSVLMTSGGGNGKNNNKKHGDNGVNQHPGQGCQ